MNFRFGDGAEVNSTETVIGTKKVTIEANIVKKYILLLLGRTSMKRGQMVLDFETDTAEILLLQDKPNSCASIVLHTLNLKQLSRSEKVRKAMKLHRQFSHAWKEKLYKLLKESKDFSDKDFLDITEECCGLCEICQKLFHPPLRPVVGLPFG